MRPPAVAAAVDPAIGALYDVVSPAVEETLLAAVRELALATPAARHDPFYGLDRGGASLRVIDRLTRHGDFRKYVSVLDVGAGLGGTARWLASRYRCRVVALDACARTVAAGARLSQRAGLAARVHGIAGSFDAVPARDAAFTQIWSVEALQHAHDRRHALAELFRVLRPGCTLALQENVRRARSLPPLGGPWRHGTVEEYRDALHAAGFRDVLVEDVSAERPDTSPVVSSARAHFERLLATRLSPADPWHAARAETARVEAVVAAGDYRTMHFFARRPSV